MGGIASVPSAAIAFQKAVGVNYGNLVPGDGDDQPIEVLDHLNYALDTIARKTGSHCPLSFQTRNTLLSIPSNSNLAAFGNISAALLAMHALYTFEKEKKQEKGPTAKDKKKNYCKYMHTTHPSFAIWHKHPLLSNCPLSKLAPQVPFNLNPDQAAKVSDLIVNIGDLEHGAQILQDLNQQIIEANTNAVKKSRQELAQKSSKATSQLPARSSKTAKLLTNLPVFDPSAIDPPEQEGVSDAEEEGWGRGESWGGGGGGEE